MVFRGRPRVSLIRRRCLVLLFVCGSCHPFELHRRYVRCFGVCTLRSVYYQLDRAVGDGLVVRFPAANVYAVVDGVVHLDSELSLARAFKKAFLCEGDS
jgi:hypothetical protein